jgi:subtilisin family serine protease
MRLGPCVGRVCAARLPFSDLMSLALDPDLLQVDLPTRFFHRLDRSGPLVRLPEARTQTGFTGLGVLAAVIDTGLDWTHSDFIDGQGRTRVAWLLDQSRPPEGRYGELEELGLGAVYHAQDLQAVLETGTGPAQGSGRDDIGHGTHVAGIIAGNNATYQGMAPGTLLVAVKAMEEGSLGFEEDRVLAALAFVERVAILENKPLVINLSFGTQLGGHDGTEPLELALDDLIERSPVPTTVVVAAGNDRSRDIHARCASSETSPCALRLFLPSTVPPAANQPASIRLDFWREGDAPFRVRLITPTAQQIDASTSNPFNEQRTPEGEIHLWMSTQPHPQNGDFETMVTLQGTAAQPLSRGVWTLEFVGASKRIDGWIGEWELGSNLTPRFLDGLDESDLVGPPATAKHVVAVGAYLSRTEWIDLDGAEQSVLGTVGTLAWFTSPGPTRDGRPKPEVAAPGYLVASALSSSANPLSPSSIFYSGGRKKYVMPDGQHALAGGTSMASPHVAGLAALALEENPHLTGEKIRQLFETASRQDSFTTGSLYERSWGFGKSDAVQLLAAADGHSGTSIDVRQSLCGVTQPWMTPDSSFTSLVLAIPRDRDGIPVGDGRNVQIESNQGSFGDETHEMNPGLYSRTLLGTGKRGHEAEITCRFEGIACPHHPKIFFAASEDEWSGQNVVGGACGCQSSSPGEPFLLFFIGWAWFLCCRKSGR